MYVHIYVCMAVCEQCPDAKIKWQWRHLAKVNSKRLSKIWSWHTWLSTHFGDRTSAVDSQILAGRPSRDSSKRRNFAYHFTMSMKSSSNNA